MVTRCSYSPLVQAFALIVQIVGAVATAFGLWQAWFKLLYGQSPWSRLRVRLCRQRGPDQYVYLKSIPSDGRVGTPWLWVEPPHDSDSPVEEQVVQLAAVIAYIKDRAEADRKHVREVERSVNDFRVSVAQQVADARTAAKAELGQHIEVRTRDQVLDLKWAIGGMLITAVGLGIALGDLCLHG